MSYSSGRIKLVLWIVRETPAAYLFSKLPLDRNPDEDDQVWIPRSMIEVITKLKEPDVLEMQFRECHVELQEWFAEKKGLI